MVEKQLIFDFDGVLMNSIEEVIYTAYNAVTDSTVTQPDQLPANYPELFRLNRFHVQPAGDFLPFAAWCIESSAAGKEQLLTRTEFTRAVALSTQPLKQRTAKFFSARGRFIKADKKRWCDLHRPYSPIWQALNALNSENIWVLTNKNRSAVVELANHFGTLISADNIFSGDDGRTKTQNFLDLRTRLQQSELSFIDDSVLNLLEIRRELSPTNISLELLHANWGYCGAEDTSLARQNGFESLTQDETIARFLV